MKTTQSIAILRARRGFTLTELMVAVVVLLVIILAVGRIFGTASEVVKAGEANADILQEVSAIEQLMRNDLDRISDEGFLLVQGVGVRNDVMNSLGGGQLLDPNRPADYIFRCDQLVFVADDLAISRQTQKMGAFIENGLDGTGNANYLGDTLPTPQSTASLLYYGHGFQLPFISPNLGVQADALWPANGGEPIQPWFRPNPGQQRIDLQSWPQGASVGGTHNGAQPAADNWTLARQEVLLADDYDSDPTHYMSRVTGAGTYRNAASDFFDGAMRSSRVDVLSNDVGRLREAIRTAGPRGVADVVFNYRPRAEKRPPTLDKSDVLLTTSVLVGNCSNFVIDWTWADGVGRELELDLDPGSGIEGAIRGVSHRGGIRPSVGAEGGTTVTEAAGRLPWFGFSDGDPSDGSPYTDVTFASSYLGDGFYDREVRLHAPLAYHPQNGIFGGATPDVDLFPDTDSATMIPQAVTTIEGGGGPVVDQPYGSGIPVYRYFAFFGLNGSEPFVRDGAGRPLTTKGSGGRVWPVYRADYTPWPSALRITATFHDARGAIDGGRNVQFTIPLPRRVQDLPEE